jgi:hypothetical protein
VCFCACEQIKGTDDPNFCVLHSIEELPSMLGYIPSFMLNYMIYLLYAQDDAHDACEL